MVSFCSFLEMHSTTMATRFPRTPTANMVAEIMSDLDSSRSAGVALWLSLRGREDGSSPETLLSPKVSLIIVHQQRTTVAARELVQEILTIIGPSKLRFLPERVTETLPRKRTTHPRVLLLLRLLSVLIQIDPHEGVPGCVYSARRCGYLNRVLMSRM